MSVNNLWTHYQPVRICSGPLQQSLRSALQLVLPEQSSKAQTSVLLITTAGFTKRGVTAQLAEWLLPFQLLVIDQVTANPDIDSIDDWIEQYACYPVAAVIGLGGGSAMDAAKAMAVMLALAKAESSPLNKLFREKSIKQPNSRLPLLLIPTTAGTGSEVTPFATIWDNRHKQKYSLASDSVYPDVALLDASLTLSLPADETLYSGLDALSHSLESLWNKHSTPMSEAYAKQAIALLADHFITALLMPSNLEARQGMQTASLLAGLAISTTRTAIAHAISYPLTSHYALPHGLACSFTLPALLEMVQSSTNCAHLSSTLRLAQNLLQQLPLEQALQAKINFPQIYSHTNEMFHPDRAGNFIMPFAASDLTQLLQRTEVLLKTAQVSVELTALLP
ncbi:phosphonoacetaldehyde reductase [Rheinheimera mangrovi]|uniref:phosphonoacetaldehyde reductase n=1 Tax=Rheinheimera mangrovi TaxID=2498451 RepID=UPI000F8E4ECF|nr:phosphonoacetaldehyde reductase [Rheinheimera mangrovi]